MKHRLQISVEVEGDTAAVTITKQHGRGRKESTGYKVTITGMDAGGWFDISNDECIPLDTAILIRKAVRAAIDKT